MKTRSIRPDLYWGKEIHGKKEFVYYGLYKGRTLLLRAYKNGRSVIVKSGTMKSLFKQLYEINESWPEKAMDKAEEKIHELLAAAMLYDAYGKKTAKEMGECFGRHARQKGGMKNWRFDEASLFARMIEVRRWMDELMAFMDLSRTPEPTYMCQKHYEEYVQVVTSVGSNTGP